MKIGVIGAGRLGICFALLCEQAGHEVLVSDVREDYVASLNERLIQTNEPEVAELLDNAKNFRATTDNTEVIRECEIIYTLVATPSLPDGSYDVSAVWQVVEDFQSAENVQGKAFVVGCTTNPGDCETLQMQLNPYGVKVFYNPEFIAQGSIIKDLRTADMVLIGGYDATFLGKIISIYSGIQTTEPRITFMSLTAAEIVKLAVNCYLTTKISYANMVGEVMINAGLGDEIENVLGAIGLDSRVGQKYLKYGYGFGGPCLPRDNRSFAAFAKKLGLEYNLGQTTDKFNDEHAEFLKTYFIRTNPYLRPFYFDYISYKKGSDILTESQQYRLCLDLLDSGFEVYIDDNEDVISQVKDFLTEKYGDKVHFGKPPTEEEVFNIEL